MSSPADIRLTPSPYPGLRPFQRNESDVFFGRDEQVDELLARLAKHRFLAVVGTSGCGKSSLVKAGMLSALDAGWMGEIGSTWYIADMRPGSQPIANLARALLDSGILGDRSAAGSEAVDMVAAVLQRGPLGIVELLREARLPEYSSLLILADQFEEIFRFRGEGDPNQALAFVNLLLATARRPDIPVYVVLTMRSDFLGKCSVFPGLPEALNDGQFLCPRLDRHQCREAIEGPASVFGAEVDEALVNRILNDIGTDPDQLPLMQHVLMRVWGWVGADDEDDKTQQPKRLTLADYNAVGGFGDALSRHADEAFREMDDRGNGRLVELMFRSLCERTSDGRDVQRPVSVAEIARVADVPVERVIDVVESFRRPDRSFLTPPVGTAINAETVVDVSHESLIRQWKRLKDWVQTENESGARYRRLLESTQLHSQGHGELLRGLELADVSEWLDAEQPTEAWAQRYGGEFNRCTEFVEISARTARKKRVGNIFWRLMVFCILPVASLAVYSHVQRREAEKAKELLAISNKDLKEEKDKLEKALKAVEEAEIEENAAAILAGIGGSGDYPSPDEFIALEGLADSEEAVRKNVVERLLTNPQPASRLGNRFAYILHAVVGLDERMREHVKDRVIEHGWPPSKDVAINLAVAELGSLLALDDQSFNNILIENYLAAMSKSRHPEQLLSAARGLAALRIEPTNEQSRHARSAILEVMREISAKGERRDSDTKSAELASGSVKGSKGNAAVLRDQKGKRPDTPSPSEESTRAQLGAVTVNNLTNLVEAFLSVPGTLTTGSQEVSTLIVAAVEETTDRNELSSLGRALRNLGGNLPAEQAAGVARQMLAAMERTSDANRLSVLGRALGSLGENLPAEQAAAAAQQILAAMEKTTDASDLHSLGYALGRLGENLPAEQGLAATQQIVAAVEKTNDRSELYSLRRALGSLGESLPAHQAAAVARQMVAAMKTADARAVSSLGYALGSFGENLPAEQGAAAAQQILAAMQEASDPRERSSLGGALGSLGEKLPAHQAAAVAEQIVGAMKTTDPFALSSLGDALASFGENLPAEQAAAAAQEILAAVKTADARALSSLGRALGGLGEKLPAEQAAAVAEQIVGAMKTTDPLALSSLGRALGSLGENLPAEQAAAAARQILAAMKTASTLALSSLARALGSLGENLPAHEAAAVAQQILTAMEESPTRYPLPSLGRALGSLGENLPPEQGAAAAKQILNAMEETTSLYTLSSLGGALGSSLENAETTSALSALKAVVCVGDLQDPVLAVLERKADRKFDGNLWKAVAWAEQQGIDVKNVPRFPLAAAQ